MITPRTAIILGLIGMAGLLCIVVAACIGMYAVASILGAAVHFLKGVL